MAVLNLINCCNPPARTPGKGVRAPGFRLRVQSLDIDVDKGRWRQEVRVPVTLDLLGMGARVFGDENYGTIKTERLKLRIVRSIAFHIPNNSIYEIYAP